MRYTFTTINIIKCENSLFLFAASKTNMKRIAQDTSRSAASLRKQQLSHFVLVQPQGHWTDT